MLDVPYLFIHDFTMHVTDFKHLKSDLPIELQMETSL